jgi:hypothetical protein
MNISIVGTAIPSVVSLADHFPVLLAGRAIQGFVNYYDHCTSGNHMPQEPSKGAGRQKCQCMIFRFYMRTSVMSIQY